MAPYALALVGRLKSQLCYSPPGRKKEQLDRIEGLISRVHPQGRYPYDLVCHAITRYRPRGQHNPLLPGHLLRGELGRMLEELSVPLHVPVGDGPERVISLEILREQYDLSEEALSRWRQAGLPCRSYRYPDGTERPGIRQSALAAFLQRYGQECGVSVPSRRRRALWRRARRLVKAHSLGLSATARMLAEDVSEEAARLLLAEQNARSAKPLFPACLHPLSQVRKTALHQAWRDRVPVRSLARGEDLPRKVVERIIRERAAAELLDGDIEFIDRPEFHSPEAEAELLRGDLPEAHWAKSGPAQRRAPEDAYFAELRRQELLSRETETALFRRYHYLKFRWWQERRRLAPSELTPPALRQLAERQAQATALRNRLVEANLRLVITVARQHARSREALADLISEGNCTLLQAVEKFDFTRGTRFCTYASWALMKNFAKSFRTEERRNEQPVADVNEVVCVVEEPAPRPVEVREQQAHEKRLVTGLLDRLTHREREILVCRFGIDGAVRPATLDEIGQRLQITRERVRQLERRALKKLRELLNRPSP